MQSTRNLLYTTDDIYNLPDGTRAELINGQMFMMAPPSARHQEILGVLFRRIADHIDSHKGSCNVYMAPYAVFLNADNRTYVEPDISVICDKNIITVWDFRSPSDDELDCNEYSFLDSVKSGIFEDFSIDFSALNI